MRIAAHFSSLLWPPKRKSSGFKTREIDSYTFESLELSCIISAKTFKPQFREAVEKIILNIPVDSEVISYRQDVFEELPGLLSGISGIQSVSIGVYLNKDLIPVEAALLRINKNRYTGSSGVMEQIFKNRINGEIGIARLHTVLVKELSVKGIFLILDPAVYGYAGNPILIPLFRDLSDLVKKTSKPVIKPIDDSLCDKRKL